MANFTVTTTPSQTARLTAAWQANTGITPTVPMIEQWLFNRLKTVVLEAERRIAEQALAEPDPF